jgi:hypothetical protein
VCGEFGYGILVNQVEPAFTILEESGVSIADHRQTEVCRTFLLMDVRDPVRNRIVINLDSPVSSGVQMQRRQGSRRWPKVVAILALLLICGVLLAAAGGYFWWRHYQTTPAYSLALIVDAAQRDDMTALEKQIDDDAIARNMMAEIRKKAAIRYGLALSGPVQGRIDTLLPTLLPRLKQMIHDEVAKEIKGFAARSDQKPFLVIALAVPSFVTITTEGDNAKASASIPNRTIDLGMRRDADLWKVTEFRDDVLLQRVVDNVMKDLPAIGEFDLNIPLLTAPSRKSPTRNRR